MFIYSSSFQDKIIDPINEKVLDSIHNKVLDPMEKKLRNNPTWMKYLMGLFILVNVVCLLSILFLEKQYILTKSFLKILLIIFNSLFIFTLLFGFSTFLNHDKIDKFISSIKFKKTVISCKKILELNQNVAEILEKSVPVDKTGLSFNKIISLTHNSYEFILAGPDKTVLKNNTIYQKNDKYIYESKYFKCFIKDKVAAFFSEENLVFIINFSESYGVLVNNSTNYAVIDKDEVSLIEKGIIISQSKPLLFNNVLSYAYNTSSICFLNSTNDQTFFLSYDGKNISINYSKITGIIMINEDNMYAQLNNNDSPLLYII